MEPLPQPVRRGSCRRLTVTREAIRFGCVCGLLVPGRLVYQEGPLTRPIQLHADLALDPAREAEAVRYFETVYRPTASRFEGYLDLRLLKLQSALVGSAPAGINYRFSITFTSEDLRLKWVASPPHQQVWGTLETFLVTHEYDFLLFEVI
jgi:hypothetical protein